MFCRLVTATSVDVTTVAWSALTLRSVRVRERKMMSRRQSVRGVRMHHRGWSADVMDVPTALAVSLWTVLDAWGMKIFWKVHAPARWILSLPLPPSPLSLPLLLNICISWQNTNRSHLHVLLHSLYADSTHADLGTPVSLLEDVLAWEMKVAQQMREGYAVCG